MVSTTIVRDTMRCDMREIRDTTEFQRRKGGPRHEAEGGIEGDSRKSPALE